MLFTTVLTCLVTIVAFERTTTTSFINFETHLNEIYKKKE